MSQANTKPILFSGIQPSGHLNIGGYIGAVNNWVNLQHDYDCLFSLVDLHTITVRQDPAQLREHCYDFLALYIACGIDPEDNILFAQSHVPEHAQLAWVLNCYTYLGELNRMTQFKDKSQKHEKNINAGLFSYPTLMAADILLYGTNLVPVGSDQKQHLELARNLAIRFNGLYGDIFTVPEPYISSTTGRIMGLQDPTKKMSKSDTNANNTVTLLDPPDTIMKKLKRSVTDSGSEIRFDENKAGISNLLTLYSALTDQSVKSLEAQYEGKGYGEFKTDVAQAIIDKLTPIQEKYHFLRPDLNRLNSILRDGAQKASDRASKMVAAVCDAVGFIQK